MLSNLENPDLVDLIPFGILSDKYGRKPFLFVCILNNSLLRVDNNSW